MHGEGKKRKASRAKGHGGVEKTLEFYALLAIGFLGVTGMLDEVGAGVMFARALRCLRR